MRGHRALWLAVGVAALSVVTLLAALAANQASAQGRWPGALAIVQIHPWLSLAMLGTLTVVLGVIVALPAERDPTRLPASGSSPAKETSPAELSIKSVPAMYTLPRDLSSFTGREEDIDRVLNAATAVGCMVAIDGMAGVGKTTFAVHVAHILADRFPDGQLFIDLYAHTAGQAPRDPGEALGTLLTAGGLAPQHIPTTVEARAALWRSRLAHKKMLLVLDNAASYEQIHPLLPAGRSLVLITSRRRLTGLDAMSLSMETLPPASASTLFARLSGRAFSNVDADGVTALMRWCGHLPLAISLLAGRLRHHSSWTVADLAAELGDSNDPLAEVRADNRAVATAFDLSYRALSPEGQRLFRCLGLHPGTDVDAYAMAAMADLPLPAARHHLSVLYSEHLLVEPVRGRYGVHDLIRAYAHTIVGSDDQTHLEQALGRLLDYYQHTAATADRLIARDTRPPPSTPVHPPAAAPKLSSITAGLEWMRIEQDNLFGCIRLATENHWHARCVGLAYAIAGYLFHAGLYRQAIGIHTDALADGRKYGSQLGQAGALYDLGSMRYMVGDIRGAIATLGQAVDIYRACDHRLGEANALKELGFAYHMAGELSDAVQTQEQALALYRELGERLGEANSLNYLGYALMAADDLTAASQLLTEAVNLYRELGDRHGEADALNHLGMVWAITGNYREAVRAQEKALPAFREFGDRLREANTLSALAYVRRITGDPAEAAKLAEQAVAIARDMGDEQGAAMNLLEVVAAKRLMGQHQGAVQRLEELLRLFRDLGDQWREAITLYQLGLVQHDAGDDDQAIQSLQQALAIFRSTGNRGAQTDVLSGIATVLLDQGEPRQAADSYRQALDLAIAIDVPLEQAHALCGLGRCARSIGETDIAVRHLQGALDIYRRLGSREAANLTTEIETVTPPG